MTRRSRRPSYRRHDGGYRARGASLVEEQIRQEEPVFDLAEWVQMDITSDDLRNYFSVKVKYPEIENVSFLGTRFNVFGRQTVLQLGSEVAHRLYLEDKVLSPHCEPDLYRMDDKILSKDDLLATVLKQTVRAEIGDGVCLCLKCFVSGIWGKTFGY